MASRTIANADDAATRGGKKMIPPSSSPSSVASTLDATVQTTMDLSEGGPTSHQQQQSRLLTTCRSLTAEDLATLSAGVMLLRLAAVAHITTLHLQAHRSRRG